MRRDTAIQGFPDFLPENSLYAKERDWPAESLGSGALRSAGERAAEPVGSELVRLLREHVVSMRHVEEALADRMERI